ncbi:MAG: HypC/HybG/HupF family hydrogenase formation chaperone [Bacillota bacterium]
MCLAVPGLVVAVAGEFADIDIRGNRLRAQASLVPDLAVGDYVLVHAGFILNRIDPAEARETLRLIEEAYAHGHRGGPSPGRPQP